MKPTLQHQTTLSGMPGRFAAQQGAPKPNASPDFALGEGEPSLRAGWLALQALISSGQGQPAEGLDLAQRALAVVPEGDDYVRGLIYAALADAYQQMDDDARAVDALERLIRHSRAVANTAAELLGVSLLGRMAIERGKEAYRQHLWQAERLEPHPGPRPRTAVGVACRLIHRFPVCFGIPPRVLSPLQRLHLGPVTSPPLCAILEAGKDQTNGPLKGDSCEETPNRAAPVPTNRGRGARRERPGLRGGDGAGCPAARDQDRIDHIHLWGGKHSER